MWYIIQTDEDKIEKNINKVEKLLVNTAKAVFSPNRTIEKKYQGAWHTEIKPLFPGYVFVDSEAAAEIIEDALTVLINTNAVKPVYIGGVFAPIKEAEQSILSSLLDSHYVISKSVGDIIDGKLIVSKGPLKEKENIVSKIDRHKRIATITLPLTEESQKMMVALEVVNKTTK